MAKETSKYDHLDVVNIRLVKEAPLISEKKVDGPVAAVEIIKDLLMEYDREIFGVLNLSTKGKPLNFNITSMGTLDSSIVHPRDVFKTSILSNAAGFICFHNHPSGDVTPSFEDNEVTLRLMQAGELMGIRMLDHVIIGGNTGNMYSYKGDGMLSKSALENVREDRFRDPEWER